MTIETPPPHAIFVKWGRFQMGVFGWPAILAVLITVLTGFLGRLLGIW